jgi:hypothetical protein
MLNWFISWIAVSGLSAWMLYVNIDSPSARFWAGTFKLLFVLVGAIWVLFI